jgi:hypothetical protein
MEIQLSRLSPDTLASLYVDLCRDEDSTAHDKFMVSLHLERLVGEEEAEEMVRELGLDVEAQRYQPSSWELE